MTASELEAPDPLVWVVIDGRWIPRREVANFGPDGLYLKDGRFVPGRVS